LFGFSVGLFFSDFFAQVKLGACIAPYLVDAYGYPYCEDGSAEYLSYGCTAPEILEPDSCEVFFLNLNFLTPKGIWLFLD
jgi:hypothetical protein